MSGNLRPILFQYDLYPDQIESFGKAKKLFTQKGMFALKETVMTDEQRTWFVHVMERLHRIGFDPFVLPLPTKYGQLLTVVEGKTWYITPWIEEDGPHILSREERLIEAAALLHLLTEKEQEFSERAVEGSYNGLLERWRTHAAELDEFASAAERKIYFSPFELAFLSSFREVMEASNAARNRLSGWMEQAGTEKRFRVVLCHGRLSASHFVGGRLLNFEHAVLDSPVRDLAVFFRNAFMRGIPENEDPFEWLQSYEKRFPLREEEKMLLAAYLAFPEPIRLSVREYVNPRPEESELIRVQKLEYRFRRFKDLCRFAERITEQSAED